MMGGKRKAEEDIYNGGSRSQQRLREFVSPPAAQPTSNPFARISLTTTTNTNMSVSFAPPTNALFVSSSDGNNNVTTDKSILTGAELKRLQERIDYFRQPFEKLKGSSFDTFVEAQLAAVNKERRLLPAHQLYGNKPSIPATTTTMPMSSASTSVPATATPALAITKPITFGLPSDNKTPVEKSPTAAPGQYPSPFFASGASGFPKTQSSSTGGSLFSMPSSNVSTKSTSSSTFGTPPLLFGASVIGSGGTASTMVNSRQPEQREAPAHGGGDIDDDDALPVEPPALAEKAKDDGYEDVFQLGKVQLFRNGKKFYSGPIKVQTTNTHDQPQLSTSRLIARDPVTGNIFFNAKIGNSVPITIRMDDKKATGHLFFVAKQSDEVEKFSIRAPKAKVEELHNVFKKLTNP